MDFIKKAASAAAIAVITTFAVFAAAPHFPSAAAGIGRLAAEPWTWAALLGVLVGARIVRVRWGFEWWDWGDVNWWFQLVTWSVGIGSLLFGLIGLSKVLPFL